MKTPPERQLWTVRQAADVLGLSIWTLRGWAYTGKIASHKLGKRLMVSPAEVDRIIHDSERPRLADRPQ